MMPFVKLDCGILDSSLWEEDAETCKVFVTMLALCGPDGVCRATAPGIARRANLSKASVKKALDKFEAPDADSRTPDEEGRRIRRVDGGYYIINYLKYRAFETPEAKRVREWRERQASKSVTDVTPVTPSNTEAEAEVEVDAEVDAEAKQPTAGGELPYVMMELGSLFKSPSRQAQQTKIGDMIERMKIPPKPLLEFLKGPGRAMDFYAACETFRKSCASPSTSVNRPQPPATAADFAASKEAKPW